VRNLISLTTVVLLVAIAGCQHAAESHAVNVGIVRSVNDMAIQNAILTQQTLYPYHFVNDAPALNELGCCELGVLAAHYREHPGNLNIRQGRTPSHLYRARVGSVMDALAKAGVDTARIHIADGMPGGDGMSSELVLAITEGRNSPSRPLYTQGGGGVGESGGGLGASGGMSGGVSGGQTGGGQAR
jgi:hypothetical protein